MLDKEHVDVSYLDGREMHVANTPCQSKMPIAKDIYVDACSVELARSASIASAFGDLMYGMLISRPDIAIVVGAFAVGLINRLMIDHGIRHGGVLQVLLGMLPNYYDHVQKYENTLIKFFGLHQIKHIGGQKVCFVVMGNMFCKELRIHRRFDLKGPSQGHSADKFEMDKHTTFKYLDLDFVFHLEPSWRQALLRFYVANSRS
ncbi:hypothetical protein L7F22_043399 [Adiantum nelumboides]|nr:hypothetical protein [Adiantum nelumboides]